MKIIKITSDIILQQLSINDAADIFNTINTQRDYLGKWLPFVEHTKKQEYTEKFIMEATNAPEDKFEYTFTIRINNTFAGIIGFKDTDRINKKTEMGYWLSENYQGNGIITKAVNKLCDFAFNELDINRIQIKCAVGNIKSKNIPKRLNFIYEGIERDGELLTGGFYTDLEIYSKLKKEVN